MAQELMTVVRDGQAAGVPIEKLDAEVTFQLLQRFGDGRLRNGKILRGAGHGALLGDRDEILELPQGECHGPLNHAEKRTGKTEVAGESARVAGFGTAQVLHGIFTMRHVPV
jgi:uncharacterized protein (DUF1786 family)